MTDAFVFQLPTAAFVLQVSAVALATLVATATPPDVVLYLEDVLAPNSFEAGLMVLQILKAVIGIAIAIVAYRGYKNNSSRPMLYIASGFIFVLGVPFVLYLGGISLVVLAGLPEIGQASVVLLAEVSQIIGLLLIVYALRM